MTALEIRGLGFRFDAAARPALEDVSLSLAPGERVALVGPNGAGKSTLLLHAAGVLPEPGAGESRGEVRLFGEPLDAKARRHVGLLFQDPDDQLFCPTVGEDVAFGPAQLGVRGDDLARRVDDALRRVGLPGFASREPHRLSGGEKKRVALAGLLAYEPRLLVFDEPTAGLDPRARRQLIELVLALEATCLFATHDLAFVAESCARTIVIDGGRIVADGATATILFDDDLMFSHGLERPRLDLAARFLPGAVAPVE